MMSNGFMPVPHLACLFLDLNSYFASVEQHINPELRGRPVAVVPMMTDRTCAIAASYEAKKYGIKTGTKIYEAKKICPDLICVLARHDAYVDYHHRIFKVVESCTPVSKIYSIDEAACYLSKSDRIPERAIHLAAHIKQRLAEEIGSTIKCSIGIAPNRFLAKIASDMQKPDGLTLLYPNYIKDAVCRLGLRDLTGINFNMERRLNRAHIYTVEDLWNISPKHARKIWGGVGGERFWYNLHGYDVPEQQTHKRVIGHSRMLDPLLRPLDAAGHVSRTLIQKATARLRRYEMCASRLVLAVKSVEGQRWARDITFPATQDSFKILEYHKMLWDIMHQQLSSRLLIKVSVTLTDLEHQKGITPDLFDDYLPQATIGFALSKAIDHINRTYGAHTVTIGPSPKTSAGFVGTKIAFNRIPDQEEFHE